MVQGVLPVAVCEQLQGWGLAPKDRAARLADRLVRLTTREYELLRYLMLRAGDALSSRELLREVWGYDDDKTATVAVHIRNLRRKLEDVPGDPQHLITVRGGGYCFRP